MEKICYISKIKYIDPKNKINSQQSLQNYKTKDKI